MEDRDIGKNGGPNRVKTELKNVRSETGREKGWIGIKKVKQGRGRHE